MKEIEKLVKEYLDYLEIERNRSPKTRENYRRYLERFVREMGISSYRGITPDAVRQFRILLARKSLKKATQSYYVIALRTFLKYLVRRGFSNVLSPETIELPKIPRRDIETLDYRELERLLAAPEGNDLKTLRDRAILEVFFSTGLRLSELCGLSRYVNLDRGEISVRGKGEKLRIVFLADGTKSVLKEYLKKRTDADEALFVSITKQGKIIGRITPRTVERIIDRYARKAGIPKKVHPHQIRHSFATDLLINGADLRSVQELLGHANISTTQVYTHLTNKELREVHETFHARRRGRA